jgi:hypothetical protein
MVAVMVSFTIIIAMVLGSMALISNSTKHSRHSQDSDMALAAAESGMNALLALLRMDPTYLESVDGPDDDYCKDDATGTPTGGPAEDVFRDDCGWNADTEIGWEDIAGDKQQWFHYSVVYYEPITEQVRALVTGRSNDVLRTQLVYLGREATDQWLYFTDYELADPNDYTTYTTWISDPSEGDYGANQLTSQGCGGGYILGADASTMKELGYRWQLGADSPVRRTYNNRGFEYPCVEPDFLLGDVIQGPVHSNDTIRASGAQFVGKFSTGDPACGNATSENTNSWQDCVNGTADFSQMPVYRDKKLELPDTKDPRNAAVNEKKGCLYRGPTRIVLNGDQMQVWSKETQAADLAGRNCGALDALRSAAGATVEIPDPEDNTNLALVYVDAGPEKDASNKTIVYQKLSSGQIGDGLPLGSYNAASHTKATKDASYTYEKAMQLRKKWDGFGNLYIEGTFSRSLTVAASGSVVITGDLVANDPKANLLGIISGNSIDIYNPIMVEYRAVRKSLLSYAWTTSIDRGLSTEWPADKHSAYDGKTDTLTIHAAMYAATAGFGLQNWKDGKLLGTLDVYGSIAQRFRGVVGHYDDQQNKLVTGYRKNYVYNDALATSSPLLFSPIKNGSWIVSWVEKTDTPAEVNK